MSDAAIMPESITTNRWRIDPVGFFSRHFVLKLGGEAITTLEMSFWTEGCEFAIAGHRFAIRRVSMCKDGFQLLADNQTVCDVKRSFWSRVFELTSVDANWTLGPTGFFTRSYQLLAGERELGTIRPLGWFSRSRVAEFAEEVPPPVQVLAIFLGLIVARRQQSHAGHGGG
jgi:hypothetical protein